MHIHNVISITNSSAVSVEDRESQPSTFTVVNPELHSLLHNHFVHEFHPL